MAGPKLSGGGKIRCTFCPLCFLKFGSWSGELRDDVRGSWAADVGEERVEVALRVEVREGGLGGAWGWAWEVGPA